MSEVPEELLRTGEVRPANHRHEGVDVTDESIGEHLISDHGLAVPAGLSFGALRGIHDRFHGQAHATDG
jgi:hypothetical protein